MQNIISYSYQVTKLMMCDTIKVLPELVHSEKKMVQYVLHSVGENNV